jgi:hypothetical protein
VFTAAAKCCFEQGEVVVVVVVVVVASRGTEVRLAVMQMCSIARYQGLDIPALSLPLSPLPARHACHCFPDVGGPAPFTPGAGGPCIAPNKRSHTLIGPPGAGTLAQTWQS